MKEKRATTDYGDEAYGTRYEEGLELRNSGLSLSPPAAARLSVARYSPKSRNVVSFRLLGFGVSFLPCFHQESSGDFLIDAYGGPVVGLIYMASSLCPFCQHSNPALAKFCNDCGSPLHGSSIAEAGAADSLSRMQRLEALRESAEEAVKAFTARQVLDKGEGVEPPDNMERWKEAVERARHDRDAGGTGLARTTILRPPPEETRSRMAPITPVGSVVQEDGHPTVQPPAPLGATQTVRLPGPAAYRRSRAALIAVLILVVSVSAYYVNRNSAQLKLWLGVNAPDAGTLIANPDRPPSLSPPAKIRLAPSSTPTEASAESTSQITTVLEDRADTPAAKPDGISNDAPARPPAAQSDPAKPIDSSAIAAKTTPETKKPATSRVDAARPPSGRSHTSSVAAAAASQRQRATDSMGSAPRDAPRVSVCTEAVAALGFCNLKGDGENK
jgi:hypothetical protein